MPPNVHDAPREHPYPLEKIAERLRTMADDADRHLHATAAADKLHFANRADDWERHRDALLGGAPGRFRQRIADLEHRHAPPEEIEAERRAYADHVGRLKASGIYAGMAALWHARWDQTRTWYGAEERRASQMLDRLTELARNVEHLRRDGLSHVPLAPGIETADGATLIEGLEASLAAYRTIAGESNPENRQRLLRQAGFISGSGLGKEAGGPVRNTAPAPDF